MHNFEHKTKKHTISYKKARIISLQPTYLIINTINKLIHFKSFFIPKNDASFYK